MFEEVTHSPLGPSQVQNPSSPISCWSFYIAVTKRLDTMSIRVGKFLPCMHGNYRGNYPVFTDTVEILSTMVEMVEMVEILKVIITDTVKILSTMVEMVEILKVVITDTVKILSTIVEMVEILKVVITDSVKLQMVETLKCPIEENLSTKLLICMYQ